MVDRTIGKIHFAVRKWCRNTIQPDLATWTKSYTFECGYTRIDCAVEIDYEKIMDMKGVVVGLCK